MSRVDESEEERERRKKGIFQLETLDKRAALVGDTEGPKEYMHPYIIPDSIMPPITDIPPSLMPLRDEEIKAKKAEKAEEYRDMVISEGGLIKEPTEETPIVKPMARYEEFKTMGAYLRQLCSLFEEEDIAFALEEVVKGGDQLNEWINDEEVPENLREGAQALLNKYGAISSLYEGIALYENQKFSSYSEELAEQVYSRFLQTAEAMNYIETFGESLEGDEEMMNNYEAFLKELGFNYLIEKEQVEVLKDLLEGALSFLAEDAGGYDKDYFLDYIFLPLCEEKGFDEESTKALVKARDLAEYLAEAAVPEFHEDGVELNVKEEEYGIVEDLMRIRGLETSDLIELVELENYPEALIQMYQITLEEVQVKYLERINDFYDNLINDLREDMHHLLEDVYQHIEGY